MAGIPNGFAPGFYNLADVMDRRIQDINADVISDAIELTSQIHTRTLNELFRTTVEPVTWYKRSVRIGGNRRPQVLTENAAPKPHRAGLRFDVGLPLQIVGDSVADNLWSRAKTTVKELNEEMMMIMDGFTNWHFDQFLTAILNNTSWNYADDSDDVGTLVILPLANNDAQLYPTRSGKTGPVVNNHYLFQAAAIATAADPFPVAQNKLKEHPTNVGPYVAQIASNLKDDVENLAAFTDLDQDFILYGDDETRVSSAAEAYMGWGNEIIGVHKTTGTVLVECDRLPDNIIVTEAIGSSTRTVAMREEPEAELQGIINQMHKPNSNLSQDDFYKRSGMGVQNRVRMTVTLIESGSYVVPTGYTAPGV